jgi:hypothetical protein
MTQNLDKQSLEKLDLNMLAKRCQRVAESHEADRPIADEARKLKQEWDQLLGTNVLTGNKSLADNLRHAESLRQRMVNMLSKC